MVTKTAHLNIRMTQSAADALKALAEAERLPLGEVIQILLDRFHPVAHESNIENWKVGIEARINVLEEQIILLSTDTKQKASHNVKVSENHTVKSEIESFRYAVIECYQSGISGFQEIAKQLSDQGFRNANGNPYHRRQVSRIISNFKNR